MQHSTRRRRSHGVYVEKSEGGFGKLFVRLLALVVALSQGQSHPRWAAAEALLTACKSFFLRRQLLDYVQSGRGVLKDVWEGQRKH